MAIHLWMLVPEDVMLVPEEVSVPILGVPVDVSMFLIFGLASPVLRTACCAPPVSATQPARRGRSERIPRACSVV